MGWKGTLRSVVAAHRRAVRADLRASRAAARAELRAAREAQREAKEELRKQQQAATEQLVARYELQLRLLATVHHDCGPIVDWSVIAAEPRPGEPTLPSERLRAAESALALYRPGLFARLFGGAKKKRAELSNAVSKARQADVEAGRAYERACKEWETARSIATAILARDTSRYFDALEGVDAFDELEEVGATVSVATPDVDLVMVDVTLPPSEIVVPDEQYSITQRGKLSTKNMPKTRRNEIYQDYVCGAGLRAAREVLAALPILAVGVTVRCPLLDAATGHTKVTPVLSVIVPRRTADTLNYEAVDPSDAMSNFLHRMGFKKTAGMLAVAPLTAEDAAPVVGDPREL